MSKYRISKKHSNFTIILNKVSQSLNYNLEALGLYVYIFSLPSDWEFYKSHLQKVCKIGIKKLNKLLCILEEHNLVKIVQIRDENGRFSHFDMQVNDGESFRINNLEECVQPEGQNDRAVKTVGRLGTAIKNIETNINNKNTIVRNDESEKETTYFEDFWKAYPVKVNKMRAIKTWDKVVKTPELAQTILNDIENRKKNDRYWLDGYIPHPTTYLNGERWNDQITIQRPATKNAQPEKVNSEIRCTVKEWGPGHPDYDRVH